MFISKEDFNNLLDIANVLSNYENLSKEFNTMTSILTYSATNEERYRKINRERNSAMRKLDKTYGNRDRKEKVFNTNL